MPPSLGRIVHYTLSDYDAAAITQRRKDDSTVANLVCGGQVFPAIVVRVFGGTTINLKVFLDGDDTYWATSRVEGADQGTWCWPPRV